MQLNQQDLHLITQQQIVQKQQISQIDTVVQCESKKSIQMDKFNSNELLIFPTKYTVIPLDSLSHVKKIQQYVQKQQKYAKTSYCRFYLRGMCIMKAQFCKFAHSFNQLVINGDGKPYNECLDFRQKPLFFIKNVPYTNLYDFQYSPRLLKSQPQSMREVSENTPLRTRIREVMHRQEWDNLLSYLQDRYPNGDFTVSMLASWFAQLGFQKPQTHCKFSDFMRYILHVHHYSQLTLIMPPRLTRATFLLRAQPTLLYELRETLLQQHRKYLEQDKQRKDIRARALPNELNKAFMCRYYMSGICDETHCKYAHHIAELKFQVGRKFLKEYRQMPKSRDQRNNFVSLHQYASKNKKYQEVTLQEINDNGELKKQIRKTMHLELYRDFLTLLEKINNKLIIELQFVKSAYDSAGFNHTDQNKFTQLQNSLVQIGFFIQTLNKAKQTYIYRIPALQILDQMYYKILKNIFQENFLNIQQQNSNSNEEMMLQSTLKRLIYTKHKALTIPFHVYKKLKQMSLKEMIQVHFHQYKNKIFFQSSSENYNKLIEFVRSFLKRKRKAQKYIFKIEQIQDQLRNQSKEQINMNLFVNLKTLLQLAVLECNKYLYHWPFNNNTIVIDNINEQKIGNVNQNNRVINLNNIQHREKLQVKDVKVIDSGDNFNESFKFAVQFLTTCSVYGVDLQGSLKINGSIDLVQVIYPLHQISGLRNDSFQKQIFVFDIFSLNQHQLSQVIPFLKCIFQDPKRIKVLHDCRQDSIALKSIFSIELSNVFDTSGMDLFIEQNRIYASKKQDTTHESLLKRIHEVKVNGLNHILLQYNAPHGINEYKEGMKAKFKLGQKFGRPMPEEFLLYSARDVEDLIEVYCCMSNMDIYKIGEYVGRMYAG